MEGQRANMATSDHNKIKYNNVLRGVVASLSFPPAGAATGNNTQNKQNKNKPEITHKGKIPKKIKGRHPPSQAVVRESNVKKNQNSTTAPHCWMTLLDDG